MRRPGLASDAALMVTTLIWGSTFVMAKSLLEQWPPVAYVTIRFGFAALALVVLFPRQVVSADAKAWRAGATLGVLMGAGFALQAIGLAYTTPTKSAFITGLTTPLVPFASLAILRIRPNLENAIGVTLASIGGLLILAPQGDVGVNMGDMLTVLATLFFAVHITLLSSYAAVVDVRQLTTLQIATAATLFFVVWMAIRAGSIFSGVNAPPEFVRNESLPLTWTTPVIWQVVYLALIATVLTFLLWTWGQARASATHAAIIFSLEPVFAAIFAVAVRGRSEWLGGYGNLGAALILAGVIISELRFTGGSDGEEGHYHSSKGGSAAVD